MAADNDLKNKVHAVMKDPDLFREIQEIARDKHLSFNQAMMEYYKKDEQ